MILTLFYIGGSLMRKNRQIGLAAMIGVGLGAAHVSAATVFDFQAEVAGGVPSAGPVYVVSHGNNTDGIGSESGTIIVDDVPTTLYTDPFGVAGNKSLQVAAISSADSRARFYWNLDSGPEVVVAGSASFDFYLDSSDLSARPSIGLQLASGGAVNGGATDLGPIVQLDGGSGAITMYSIADGAVTADQSVSTNTVGNLAVAFDSTLGTYTVTLDGNAITAGGGTITSFSYYAGLGVTVDSLVLYNAISSESRAFVDNVTLGVIPEPASLGLLAAGGMMMVCRRKRC